MANIALIVGNVQYDHLSTLDCCHDDAHAIKELLEATEKFDNIEVILNADSLQLKDRIRTTVDAHTSITEAFFYFTGHGFQHDTEFFFCATNFDSKRPNETGLSNTELHTLLRAADAELVVKVVDACSSGTLLVKADGSFWTTAKHSFRNLIQIASCLDSQNSLTGDPLSVFTDKFIAAALRKLEGPVYYSDIVNALRDDFLENNFQTPHFVSQGTGREEFVENAKRLDELRAKLSASLNDTTEAAPTVPSVVEHPTTVLDILQKAETRFANKDTAQTFISRLFDKLAGKASSGFFRDLFTSEVVAHPDFREPTTRAFIIRVLANEKRPDNFVTATVTREHKLRDPWGLTRFAASILDPDEAVSHYELHLNCELEKSQLKIALTPKFGSLRRFVLVVSCAPSLEFCYVMEMLTQHLLKDWGAFDTDGSEIVRRWYKMRWTDNCDGLVDKIFDKLRSVVQESVDSTAQALLQS